MRLSTNSLGATLAAVSLACTLGACGASATTGGGTAASAVVAEAPCGTSANEVLGRTAGAVATRIYSAELSSSEVSTDKREVEGYAPLLQAVAAGETPAITVAVTHLVYSGTHIVRLRVTTGTKVLADVGGPYIIAPVAGTLRLEGRTIARYVLSVQDDLGYVKLETRYIGVPLVMRAYGRGVPIEGLVPGPTDIPESGPVRYRGVVYRAFSFDAQAFPSGTLRISLLVPLPAGLARESCLTIESHELGTVAQRISRRFALAPSDFAKYVRLVDTMTDGRAYVRQGSRQLAGAPGGTPGSLPHAGRVRFHGTTYAVSSFTAETSVGQVRVYELIAG